MATTSLEIRSGQTIRNVYVPPQNVYSQILARAPEFGALSPVDIAVREHGWKYISDRLAVLEEGEAGLKTLEHEIISHVTTSRSPNNHEHRRSLEINHAAEACRSVLDYVALLGEDSQAEPARIERLAHAAIGALVQRIGKPLAFSLAGSSGKYSAWFSSWEQAQTPEYKVPRAV